MAVPQQRNEKKRKRRGNTGHTVKQRRFLLDRSPVGDIEAASLEYEHNRDLAQQPGDWLENEYLEEPTFGERLLLERESILDHHIDYDDYDDDDGDYYNPDIGNDLDDLYNESDYAGEW